MGTGSCWPAGQGGSCSSSQGLEGGREGTSECSIFFFFFLQAGTLVEQVQVLRDERVQVFLLNAKYFFPHILCDEFAHTLVRFSQPEFRLNLFKNVNE